jgi:cytoskeletal protein CcmA (bactofilin family)
MSCPPEQVLSVYLDRELEPSERSALEAHLVRCAPCRGRVLSLRQEARLLADVLLGRERVPLRVATQRAPARGLALGAVPAIAATALAAAVLGWLADVPFLPISPFRLVGVFDVAFDLVFMLRDRTPEFFSFAVAVAALASASALLSVLLSAVLRRVARPGASTLAAALALLAAPAESHAHFGLHRHEDFALPAGETHAGTLVASGDTVNVDGAVEGDLVVMAERLALRGEVLGNVLALARTVEIAGHVRGAVFCLCARTYVSGEIDSDFYVVTEELSFVGSGRVARNLTFMADRAVLEGEIGRDLMAAGERAEVRGRVGRDVYAWDARVMLRDGARVGGNLTAYVEEDQKVEVAPGAVVAGEVASHPLPWPRETAMSRYRSPGFYVLHVILLAAAFVVGMVLHVVSPETLDARLESAGEFFRTLGIGFAALVATPLALALLAVTLVGLPLALIGLGVYLFALYAGGIAVAALVGRTLVDVEPGSARSFALALLLGLLVVGVLGHLPFLGVLIYGIVIPTGVGLLVGRAREVWRIRTALA